MPNRDFEICNSKLKRCRCYCHIEDTFAVNECIYIEVPCVILAHTQVGFFEPVLFVVPTFPLSCVHLSLRRSSSESSMVVLVPGAADLIKSWPSWLTESRSLWTGSTLLSWRSYNNKYNYMTSNLSPYKRIFLITMIHWKPELAFWFPLSISYLSVALLKWAEYLLLMGKNLINKKGCGFLASNKKFINLYKLSSIKKIHKMACHAHDILATTWFGLQCAHYIKPR